MNGGDLDEARILSTEKQRMRSTLLCYNADKHDKTKNIKLIDGDGREGDALSPCIDVICDVHTNAKG